MKNHFIVSLFVFSFFIIQVQAQQFTVKQVKGNKAIVEFGSDEVVELGQTYNVNPQALSEATNATKNKRDYILGFDFDFSNVNSTSNLPASQDRSILNLNLDLKFGWNTNRLEFGPLLTLNYIRDNSNNFNNAKPLTTYGLGGFLTYNFQPNVTGEELIFSADIQAAYFSSDSSTTAQNASSIAKERFEVQTGPYVKWFGLSENHCLTLGVVYRYGKSEFSTSTETLNGVAAVAGISTYF